MVRPAPSFRELSAAFQRGQWETVASRGELVAAKLLGQPEQAIYAPAAVMMAAWARAEEGYLPASIGLLERGLSHIADPLAVRELGGLDSYYLLLVELYLLTGDQPAALTHLAAMGGPDAPLSMRFPVQRFAASMAAAEGDDRRTAAYLDTAASLAAELHDRRAPELVDGDRAIWLASSGRVGEAANAAEVWAAPFPRRAPKAWLARHAVAVCSVISASAADAADTSLAQVWLGHGERAVPHLRGGGAIRGEAEMALARSAVARTAGDLEVAEAEAQRAARNFHRLGMRPAAAAARLRLAQISADRGFDASSEAAFRSVADELRSLGQHRLARVADQHSVPSSGTASSIR